MRSHPPNKPKPTGATVKITDAKPIYRDLIGTTGTVTGFDYGMNLVDTGNDELLFDDDCLKDQ